MTPDFRALCAELVELSAPVDSISQLSERLQKLNELADRARTLLDQPEPVAPSDPISELVSQCRPLEPEMAEHLTPQARWRLYGDEAQPVAEGPTDEELRDMADFDCDFDRYDTTDSDGREGVSWECSDKNLVEYARAVLAKYGTPTPHPPAAGEVAELVEWLRFEADDDDRHDQTFWLDGAQLRRIADLLQLLHPQPVAVSERLPGPEDCDELETCWQWEPDINGHHPLGLWELVHRDWVSNPGSDATHWLPANALPTPEAKP